ncbi:hypothetical protein CCACVL1_26918 [Corchorus capsularis]|uniref:Uncharacterized protein n=1 Tax=Corchorus capsularis TaxID=210143 RepID=A0A1R3GCW3_COCAP|nr:hypothetical protein CCACVL1_26918 [Corchorus capsularis]
MVLISEDMAAAAQQLMQLSDEDNSSVSSSSNGVDEKKILKASKSCKRLISHDQYHHQDEITSAKIEEIFGKEEEILRLRASNKKRKYRFLDSIYKETKPIKVSYGKNQLWY